MKLLDCALCAYCSDRISLECLYIDVSRQYGQGWSFQGVRRPRPGPPSFAGFTESPTDAHSERLESPEGLDLAVMLNAKDLNRFPAEARGTIDKLSQASSYSMVGLVRIATTWSELAELRLATERLAELATTSA